MNPKIKKIITTNLIIMFLLVFIWSGCKLFVYFREIGKTNEAYEGAQEMVQIATIPQETIQQENNSGVTIPSDQIDSQPTEPIEYTGPKIQLDIDWDTLLSQGEDVIGWLYIPNTNINYPLVHFDNWYYLDHDYMGNYSKGGSIFLDGRADIDSQNAIIYGHNMSADIMFHRLRYYAEQKYADEHKYIYLATKDETRLYKVFAVMYTVGASETYTWEFSDDSEMTFEEYINRSISESAVATDTREITKDDKIITLSTCTGREDKNRLVVQAVLLETY